MYVRFVKTTVNQFGGTSKFSAALSMSEPMEIFRFLFWPWSALGQVFDDLCSTWRHNIGQRLGQWQMGGQAVRNTGAAPCLLAGIICEWICDQFSRVTNDCVQ